VRGGGELGHVASGGRVDRGSRPRARAERVVVPIPHREPGDRLDLARLVPSGRSLLLSFAIVASTLLAWFGARETGVFAVRSVDVRGVSPGVSAQVRRALQPVAGTSLLKLDVAAAERAVEALPTVESATLDRAFPYTLRVVVVPERAVAVVRQGADAYLISRKGRVIATVARGERRQLARIWANRDVQLTPGAFVAGELATAVGAVAPLAGSGFPGRVTSVTATPEALTLRLRSGVELRLGDPLNVRLKLAVAARVLPLVGDDTVYLDVSVPERPVAGTTLNSQVEVYGATSTTP
jgi:cell division protein FtsQ